MLWCPSTSLVVEVKRARESNVVWWWSTCLSDDNRNLSCSRLLYDVCEREWNESSPYQQQTINCPFPSPFLQVILASASSKNQNTFNPISHLALELNTKIVNLARACQTFTSWHCMKYRTKCFHFLYKYTTLSRFSLCDWQKRFLCWAVASRHLLVVFGLWGYSSAIFRQVFWLPK